MKNGNNFEKTTITKEILQGILNLSPGSCASDIDENNDSRRDNYFRADESDSCSEFEIQDNFDDLSCCGTNSGEQIVSNTANK